MPIKSRQTKVKAMISNISNLEVLVYWANVIVIAALALSFLGGAASIVLSSWLSKLKDEQSKVEKLEAVKKLKEIELQNLALRVDLTKGEETVAKLQIEAADAQRELLKVRNKIQPRRFTGKQIAIILESLKANPETISISYLSHDAESNKFAKQIAEIFKKAGWSVSNFGSLIVNGPTPVGLIIFLHDKQSIPSWALTLTHTFSKVGFSVDIMEGIGIIGLAVGAKPQ